MNLEDLRLEHFIPLTGQPFDCHVQPEGPPFPLILTSAQPLGMQAWPAGSERRIPFSLLFSGPRQPVLPQRIYLVEHAQLGSLEIFMVPIGPSAEGMQYEVIFT